MYMFQYCICGVDGLVWIMIEYIQSYIEYILLVFYFGSLHYLSWTRFILYALKTLLDFIVIHHYKNALGVYLRLFIGFIMLLRNFSEEDAWNFIMFMFAMSIAQIITLGLHLAKCHHASSANILIYFVVTWI
jgi:hypothetical protein